MKKTLLLTTLFFSGIIFPGKGMTINVYGHDDACTGSVGYVYVQVTGGIAPYTYLWSTGDTTYFVNNLPASTYTVTVTDNVGTTASASTTILNGQVDLNNAISPWSVMSPCSNTWCIGNMMWNDANILGTPPYNFTSSSGIVYPNLPNPGETTIDGICSGTLTVYVTDGIGCTGQISVCVDSMTVQNPTLSVTPACNSQANGSLMIGNLIASSPCGLFNSFETVVYDLSYNYVTGGVPIYSSADTIPFLNAGSYFLGIRDLNAVTGCIQYFPFTVPDLGPTCSTVQGDVFVDMNINCSNDAGDFIVPGTIIEFTPGPWYGYTNSSGHYSANLPWGNYNMIQYPPASLIQLCPANPFPITLSSSSTNVTVDFADTSNIPFDVSATVSHGAAHPGFNFSYGASVMNHSYTSSGMLTVTFNYNPLLSFISANPAPFSTSAGQVVWQLSQVNAFQATGATVTLSVPPNPALIGDTLTATVNVQTATAETNLANNVDSTSHIITGSFDPNLKSVEPTGSFIPTTAGSFDYNIEFQNTGNDTAFNIEVIDTLNPNLDVTTFEPGASSHSFTTELTGQGVIHFYFNNINLPDSTTDEPHSHGFVSFSIRPKQYLPHGTVISNTSNIVFDFNPPINTNTIQNAVDLTLAIQTSPSSQPCTGQPLTLFMIPEFQNTTTWQWRYITCSGPLLGYGDSITVSTPTIGHYYVRDSAATIPLGSCYQKTIYGYPLPNPSITPSGSTTLCQGNSVTLNSSAGSSFLWSTGATTQSINVSSAGNYFVTVTNAGGCSASTSAITVTVNPLPTASITPDGPTIFCQGGSVMLASNAANNYLWSNSSTSQSINVSSSGNYVVTVTDANNCSASTSESVIVNSLPTASITPSGPTTFCQGGSVTLTAGGANNYLWSNSSSSQSITVSSLGNYFVTVTDANNCSTSTLQSVTVNPNPLVPNIIQNSDSLICDAANGYQWYFGSVIIPGATAQSYHPLQNGNYSVVVTDINNCTASSTDYPFILTSVESFRIENSTSIFPNPNDGIFTLLIGNQEFTNSAICISNALGEQILKRKIISKKTEIDLSSHPKGIYFVKVMQDGKTTMRKVVCL